jgi:hypothetical protein
MHTDFDSIRSERQIVRAVPNQQHQTENPYSIDRPSRKLISLEIGVRSLVDLIVEDKQSRSVDVVERFEFREEDAKTMQKAYGVGEPGNILVEEERRNDEERSDVVNEERFLADAVSSIQDIFDGHVVNVVEARENEEEARHMISP